MKQAVLYFACDYEARCENTSTPDKNWRGARQLARNAGWWLGPDGVALCPEHKQHHAIRTGGPRSKG